MGNFDPLLNDMSSKQAFYRALTTPEEVRRTGCTIRYYPGSSSDKLFKRVCNFRDPPIIRVCNETGLWSPSLYDIEIERACGMYTSIFKRKYKNMFCYLCNIEYSYSLRELERHVFSGDASNTFRLSFSSLVDFSDEGSDDYNFNAASSMAVVKCDSNQIYDNYTVSLFLITHNNTTLPKS